MRLHLSSGCRFTWHSAPDKFPPYRRPRETDNRALFPSLRRDCRRRLPCSRRSNPLPRHRGRRSSAPGALPTSFCPGPTARSSKSCRPWSARRSTPESVAGNPASAGAITPRSRAPCRARGTENPPSDAPLTYARTTRMQRPLSGRKGRRDRRLEARPLGMARKISRKIFADCTIPLPSGKR